MQKVFFLWLAFLPTLLMAEAPNWGKTGHRATAQIATKYLTKKAKKNINKLLKGESMALVSTYGDDIKSDSNYDQYSIWHYVNIPEGQTYEEIKEELGPNIITALDTIKKGLKDPATPTEKKRFYLKMLIHLIGDLHQPLHVGRPDDKGGNTIQVFWFEQVSNLHKVWDSDLLDYFKMSYSELAANELPLSPNTIRDIQQGTPVDWLNESAQIADKIYDSAEYGSHLGYDYAYDWMGVIREQLQKGGIRLAQELNAIFG